MDGDRKIAFSPPYGDGTLMKSLLVRVYRFSPPYGDGTFYKMAMENEFRFSPPYGDGTRYRCECGAFKGFSPPYGDGTLNISQNTAKLKSRMAGKYSLYYNDVLLR